MTLPLLLLTYPARMTLETSYLMTLSLLSLTLEERGLFLVKNAAGGKLPTSDCFLKKKGVVISVMINKKKSIAIILIAFFM